MGPIWGRQDPGGTHVGPMNLAIWGIEWSASGIAALCCIESLDQNIGCEVNDIIMSCTNYLWETSFQYIAFSAYYVRILFSR